ncbi:MAG: large-conductance mechanosensitive channel protein MscL [Bacteroidales bacterium]|nr:large-conductance mechanosensitive channel protein MscL [Candidatus Equibacterium intestinale]
MGKFLNEFKEFAIKGNVIDMAVGVVIGGAFGKIVSSLVSDIIMPLIGKLVGGVDFTSWKWVLSEAVGDKAEVAVTYGNFIQVILDFLIIAWCIFLVVKGINKLSDLKKKEEAPAEPEPEPATPEDILLLREIRDSLKK